MADAKGTTVRGGQTTQGTVEDKPDATIPTPVTAKAAAPTPTGDQSTPTPATEKGEAPTPVKADRPTPATEKAFKPITPDDDDKNPVKVKVPKDADEIAKEGTALGAAGADATGGNIPPVISSDQPIPGKRIWSLDADHNVNLRNGGPGSNTNPDLVELGG